MDKDEYKSLKDAFLVFVSNSKMPVVVRDFLVHLASKKLYFSGSIIHRIGRELFDEGKINMRISGRTVIFWSKFLVFRMPKK